MRTREGVPRKAVLALIVYSVATGVLIPLLTQPLAAAMGWNIASWRIPAYAAAGAVLFAIGRMSGERLPHARGWAGLATLMLPLVLETVVGRLPVRPTGWAVAFFISLASPLWAGLLAAVGAIRTETPRALMGAAIAGAGAALLVVPVAAYAVAVDQIPMLVLHLATGVATVFLWWLARRQLADCGPATCAGALLLLYAAYSLTVGGRSVWSSVDWRQAAVPLLLLAVFSGLSFWTWMWMLLRVRFGRFTLHPLAGWTASAVLGLPFIFFMSWRADASAAIALCALAVGLRAQEADEQPTALGLSES